MKYVGRIIAVVVVVGLIVWALDYIAHDQDGFKAKNDWGISKDNPLK